MADPNEGDKRARSDSGAARREDRDGREDLSERIAKARAAAEPEPPGQAAAKYHSLSMAWRMTIDLVVGSAVGFGIGYGLDELIGTLPLFMIVFGLLGVAAGMKLVIDTAREMNAKRDSRGGTDDQA